MNMCAKATSTGHVAPLSTVLVLNNYTQTGIGDFGLNLTRSLKEAGLLVEVRETSLGWKGLLSDLKVILTHDATLVANIGLTSWGKSGVRNFLGFLGLGIRSRRKQTTVILHNTIEIIDQKDAGYVFSHLTTIGAQFAVGLIRKAKVIAVSYQVYHTLLQKYKFNNLKYLAHPCTYDATDAFHENNTVNQKRVVTVGYLAKYKGIEAFISVAKELRDAAKFSIIGGTHRILNSDPAFIEWHKSVLNAAEDAGVEIMGYLTNEKMFDELKHSTLGMLSYTSSSGASGSLSTMASAGLPAVTSNLPEFEFVAKDGAGIVTANCNDIATLTSIVASTLNDKDTLSQLSDKQRNYAKNHSWNSFAKEVTSFITLAQE